LYPTTSGTNYAPAINKPAWADMPVVEFPAGTTVRVEACDQNEADTLSYAWSKLSGPGTVTFATPTGTVSAVSFSAAGSYVLRATVSDGKGGVVTSDVTVTVNAAGSPPVVLGNYSALTIAENADTDGFCVRLSKAPTNTVTVTIARTAGDPGINMRSIASGNGATTFNSSDWSTWKAFRTGTSQDGDATNDTATFTLSVPGYVSATVTVTEVDDDTTLTLAAGTGGTVSPAGATVVTKGAATIISAVSAGGYCFGGWTVTSGAATFGNSGASETTVTISAPATIQADFVLIGGAVAPAAPTGLTATAVATNQIELAWTDNATNETGYVVNRSLDSTNWTFVTLTAVNATNYSNTGLATNTLYYYRVAASNAGGISAYCYASARTWTAYEQWQRLYFDLAGLNNLSISGPTADPDQDGLNNEQEYWAGTIPTNAASCLVLYALTNNPALPGEYVVRWQSATGRLYTVQAATNLVAGFTNLVTHRPATPPVNVHTDNVSGVGCRFYRVQVE
jgi:hypothetical protein